jgi:preprotein translocase subunit SecD
MEKPMLRTLLSLSVTVLALGALPAAADVYKYKDERGNVQYTDKPQTLPAERINVQSQKSNTVTVQARQEADMKRMQDAAAARTSSSTQAADQKTGSQLNAKDKAERCSKARERYDSYMTSQRLYQQGENGERRYLSDKELSEARVNAKAAMDAMCQ